MPIVADGMSRFTLTDAIGYRVQCQTEEGSPSRRYDLLHTNNTNYYDSLAAWGMFNRGDPGSLYCEQLLSINFFLVDLPSEGCHSAKKAHVL